MPDENVWQGFFDPGHALRLLALDEAIGDAVDFGCGYGTFAIPAAQIIRGQLHAFDIEPEMIAATRQKATAAGAANIRFHLGDFVSNGTGLVAGSVDYVMLFNLLHAEHPRGLLREAHRILRVGGQLAIMHWNYDPLTPRGPPLAIRPRPEQCRQWLAEEKFDVIKAGVDLPPYHYGMVGRKGAP